MRIAIPPHLPPARAGDVPRGSKGPEELRELGRLREPIRHQGQAGGLDLGVIGGVKQAETGLIKIIRHHNKANIHFRLFCHHGHDVMGRSTIGPKGCCHVSDLMYGASEVPESENGWQLDNHLCINHLDKHLFRHHLPSPHTLTHQPPIPVTC